MKEDDVVTPSQLYRSFGDYMGQVQWGRKSFVVQRRGQPMARLTREARPSKDGKFRFPRPKYEQVTPGEFRRRMGDYLAQVRFGGQRFLITRWGVVVAIVKPIK
jgi:hypothetical protein